MSPPVTMLAVPIVSSTKPQKIPACISPARGSLNIFVWTNAYSTRPPSRRGSLANGRGARRPGGREDPQVAGHGEGEERGRAPEDEEDQRVGRDVGRTVVGSPSGPRRSSRRGRASPARAARGRTGRRASRGRGRGRRRSPRATRAAPFGLPGQVDDQASGRGRRRRPAERSASGVFAPALGAHRLGQARAPRSR